LAKLVPLPIRRFFVKNWCENEEAGAPSHQSGARMSQRSDAKAGQMMVAKWWRFLRR
jgi:hypothetical protein